MVTGSLQSRHSRSTTPADVAKQPGHWLLASLGKRVLRPGGLKLTRELIGRLGPSHEDDVVEFAPGLGVTARIMLAQHPRSYIGVEREWGVADRLQGELGSENVPSVITSKPAIRYHFKTGQ